MLTIYMSNNMTKSYLFIVGLVMSTSCFAVDITTSNGIHIVANTISIDIKTGTSTYEGDVAVTQDSMSFDADKITVHETNKVLTKFIATGSPVVFINQLATAYLAAVVLQPKRRLLHRLSCVSYCYQEQAREFSGREMRRI